MKTIIANPPFSVNWSADVSFLKDERYAEYGKLAPKSKADYAFIQDMISKLDKDGIMAVVIPHGVLFRGASEGHIRRYLIETMNCLDAVIGLPANIFFGTSIPTCIMVFRKKRTAEDNVMFIDASTDFEKVKNKNLMTSPDIDKISNTYHHRESIEKYSYAATLKDIADNNYNLNIPRYVSNFEDEPEIDIYAVMSDIESLEKRRGQLDKEIDGFLVELGIKKPKTSKQTTYENQLKLF